MKYTYKDFETGRQRWTRGKFAGWTGPTGLLNVKYAIFQRKSDSLLVPEYLLSKDSKRKIAILNLKPTFKKGLPGLGMSQIYTEIPTDIPLITTETDERGMPKGEK